MLILLFLAWIVFNGRITLEVVLIGAAICPAIFWFMCRFLDYNAKREMRFYRRLPLYAQYLWLLLKEITAANFIVFRLILTRKEMIEPVIVTLKTPLQSETLRVLLANSFTLTPGTITVAMSDNELVVHCLDKGLAIGLENSSFERLLLKIEKEEG